MASLTRDNLAALLKAKIEAQAAYSAAVRESLDGERNAIPADEQIARDLRRRATLAVSCAADNAYHDALDSLLASEAA